MNKLKVDFDNPEYGWIEILISDGINTVKMDVDSKSYSFGELTTALTGLIDECGEFSVTWLEEPGETQWKFQKQQSKVIFQSQYLLSSQPPFRFSGSYQEVCFPFWRALQSLKGRFTKQELEEKIEDEFPFSELDRLTKKIKMMKSQTQD